MLKKKKRVYINTRKLVFSNRLEQARENLTWFTDKLQKYEIKHLVSPNSVKVSFPVYEDLLLASSEMTGSLGEKIYLDTIYRIKVFVDPSLKPNQVKSEYNPNE